MNALPPDAEANAQSMPNNLLHSPDKIPVSDRESPESPEVEAVAGCPLKIIPVCNIDMDDEMRNEDINSDVDKTGREEKSSEVT